jgi:prophage antirepressor-like protein
MEDVLPTLRTKGYYATNKTKNDFIDARDIPYISVLINEKPVRCVEIEKNKWFSINDYHTSIGSRTESTQTARKLNLKQPLAAKIWLFGNTHPAWFTTELGLQLIASGSRIFTANQLKLSL